jgi:hypothetical protein
MAEAGARSIDRVGAFDASVTQPHLIPQGKARPVWWVEDFLTVSGQEGVREDYGGLLLAMAVPKA